MFLSFADATSHIRVRSPQSGLAETRLGSPRISADFRSLSRTCSGVSTWFTWTSTTPTAISRSSSYSFRRRRGANPFRLQAATPQVGHVPPAVLVVFVEGPVREGIGTRQRHLDGPSCVLLHECKLRLVVGLPEASPVDAGRRRAIPSVSSSANAVGRRKGTSAPNERAKSAIPLSSGLTIRRSRDGIFEPRRKSNRAVVLPHQGDILAMDSLQATACRYDRGGFCGHIGLFLVGEFTHRASLSDRPRTCVEPADSHLVVRVLVAAEDDGLPDSRGSSITSADFRPKESVPPLTTNVSYPIRNRFPGKTSPHEDSLSTHPNTLAAPSPRLSSLR